MSGRGVKTATFENWKKTNKYLQLDATKKILTCDICVKWKAKLPGTNAFITGSTNLKSSAVTEHVKSKLHKQALDLKNRNRQPLRTEMCECSYRQCQLMPPLPRQSTICMGTLTPEERNAMQYLFDIAYMIAYKGGPYSDFVDHIEIEKLHGVKFMPGGTYENDKGCLHATHSFCRKSTVRKTSQGQTQESKFCNCVS